jgi:hypothetical protein
MHVDPLPALPVSSRYFDRMLTVSSVEQVSIP